MANHDQKFIQKRNFYKIIPVFVTFFGTFIFWTLGGGKGEEAQAAGLHVSGINIKIPEAVPNDLSLDKMALYEKALKDSIALLKQKKSDPYSDLNTLEEALSKYEQEQLGSSGINQEGVGNRKPQAFSKRNNSLKLVSEDTVKPQVKKEHPFSFKNSTTASNKKRKGLKTNISNSSNSVQERTAEIDSKLDKLYKQLDHMESAAAQQKGTPAGSSGYTASNNVKYKESDPELDRLENMMKMATENSGSDPEMEQINGMLEKILDIQHPERIREKYKEKSAKERGRVFSVDSEAKHNNVGYTGADHYRQRLEQYKQDTALINSGKIFSVSKAPRNTGFHGLSSNQSKEQGNIIAAVIHETKTMVGGETVKMRLEDDIYINGTRIPKGNFIYGMGQINGERLEITISSVRYGNVLYPIELEVYDADGLPGVSIYGAMEGQMARQTLDRTSRRVDLGSFSPTIEAQAASAAIEGTKSLISKKMKVVKVTVKANHNIFLVDKNSK
jgi:hypothetical protein